MKCHYEMYDGFPPETTLQGIIQLHQRVFTGQTPEQLFQEFEEMKNRRLLTIVATDDQTIVGYKMGYQRKPGHFYSWLGCVNPDYRRQGIAGELMRQQHDWCKTKGYQTVRTHTRNQWRDMLILNLRHGFDIIGTVTSTNSHTTLVLEKTL
ncbi:GNAT family N-acetyltransferase [Larkinella humicola]|uniref:GNAT family N-acetyltransferase n=1 Tax=Larkinella humicola TaxID=2607654 RepID=A0A5N1JB60_9BACT|nr:GNAT family N-acetyltransferase [Larkinella humicola]KAA9349907.1 GNAT family N-acetyltransferase [Larkinella humicola]